MAEQVLVSTAYLPPVEYFSHISGADTVIIESEENYLKQTYRNRCYILSSHGPQLLSVPVHKGNDLKTRIRDIRIDYSKRWQQVHTGAIRSSYGCSPFFQHYFEEIELSINRNNKYLIDLNFSLLELICKYLNINTKIQNSVCFTAPGTITDDYRYSITPKNESGYSQKKYFQVFDDSGFIPRLSIIDLIFNMGPDSGKNL